MNAVGAVGATNREVDDAVMQGAVMVDSREAAKVEAGEILMSGASVYAELGEIVGWYEGQACGGASRVQVTGTGSGGLGGGGLVLEAIAASLRAKGASTA